MHLLATPRCHCICFCFLQMSPARVHKRMAGRLVCAEGRVGALSTYPAGIDVTADADRSVDILAIAVEPGRMALAAAESELPEGQLIERISGEDPALLALARNLAFESTHNGERPWTARYGIRPAGRQLRHPCSDSRRRAVSSVPNRRARKSKPRSVLCHSLMHDLTKSGGGLGRIRRALRAVHDRGSGLVQSTRSAASIRLSAPVTMRLFKIAIGCQGNYAPEVGEPVRSTELRNPLSPKYSKTFKRRSRKTEKKIAKAWRRYPFR
jgi:hypothetical protein